MQNLTEGENAIMGALGGVIEVSIFQSTNYWKNAAQQGLPFTLDPRITYRGYAANCTNMAAVTCFQFGANGWVKKLFTGGVSRELSMGEELASGFAAGFLSGAVCSPLELIMIQQQRKGGSFLGTAGGVMRGGLASVYRGFFTCANREGIYSAGYLGVAPVIRKQLMEAYPEMSEDAARFPAAIAGGFFACYLSHPLDTIKTCMQGDAEGAKFRKIGDTGRTLLQEGGFFSLYRGAVWRCGRQIGAVFLLDKVRTTLSPVVFPGKFKEVEV